MVMWKSAAGLMTVAFVFQRLISQHAFGFGALVVFPAKPSPNETMAAVFYEKHGSTAVLQYSDKYARPLLKPNQVLVRVVFSSINPCDFKTRRNPDAGAAIPKPKIPGEDIAGTIVDSNGHAKWPDGRRVAAMMPIVGSRWGSAAEYVAVDVEALAVIPDGVSLEQAAALPLTSLTAVQALEKVKDLVRRDGTTPEIKLKKRILIQAGAGGVGSFAIQYAKHVLGMHVIATASRAKSEMLQSWGCDEVIDYTTTSFEEVLAEHPVDIVLDTMSWAYEERTLSSKVVKPGGYYLNILSSDWGFPDNKEVANGLTTIKNVIKSIIVPSSLFVHYSLVTVQPNGKMLQQILDLVTESKIIPIIDSVYPLRSAQDAYERLESGRATGKILLNHTIASSNE